MYWMDRTNMELERKRGFIPEHNEIIQSKHGPYIKDKNDDIIWIHEDELNQQPQKKISKQ